MPLLQCTYRQSTVRWVPPVRTHCSSRPLCRVCTVTHSGVQCHWRTCHWDTSLGSAYPLGNSNPLGRALGQSCRRLLDSSDRAHTDQPLPSDLRVKKGSEDGDGMESLEVTRTLVFISECYPFSYFSEQTGQRDYQIPLKMKQVSNLSPTPPKKASVQKEVPASSV